MLVVLNGYPGVGKLTIGIELIRLIDGRLLDIHSVYNIAFALTEYRTEAFYDTVRAVQSIADERVLALPPEVPIVLTEILTKGSDWADECWRRLMTLAEARRPLCMVHLRCDLEENKRRIHSEGRRLTRKPRDPAMAERNQEGGAVLMGRDIANYLALDVTKLSAYHAASEIASWLESRS
ncbi:MAG: AAA family ATPase [Pseudomonadota bacterium]